MEIGLFGSLKNEQRCKTKFTKTNKINKWKRR